MPSRTSQPALQMIGVGDVPGCARGADPVPFLRLYGAQVLRVILNDRTYGSALPCVQAAFAAGYR
ncbi:MAG: hypothetical protein ABI339_07215, partial [Solirubrobacteraceae bacterium]